MNCPSSRSTSSQFGVKSRAAREKSGTNSFGSAKLAPMSLQSRAGFSNLRACCCILFRILSFAHMLPIRMEQGFPRWSRPGQVLVPSSLSPRVCPKGRAIAFRSCSDRFGQSVEHRSVSFETRYCLDRYATNPVPFHHFFLAQIDRSYTSTSICYMIHDTLPLRHDDNKSYFHSSIVFL